jgi:hypothetical protein
MLNFAQETYTTYTTTNVDSGSSLFSGVFLIFWLAFAILMVAAMWKVFTKAGKAGWASIIPIYNTIVQIEIVGRPIWWIVLLFIPFVNVVVGIILANDLAKSFGRGTGTTLLLIFLPFIGYPMLAFGDATYTGPAASGGSSSSSSTVASAPVAAPEGTENITPPAPTA